MTTLYRTVLIETVSQSYALLHGTVAIRDDRLPRVLHSGTPGPHWLTCTQAPGYVHPADMLGWTALVPIEAEEETLERQRFSQAVPDVLHRYTTPWTLYTPQEPK